MDKLALYDYDYARLSDSEKKSPHPPTPTQRKRWSHMCDPLRVKLQRNWAFLTKFIKSKVKPRRPESHSSRKSTQTSCTVISPSWFTSQASNIPAAPSPFPPKTDAKQIKQKQLSNTKCTGFAPKFVRHGLPSSTEKPICPYGPCWKCPLQLFSHEAKILANIITQI